MCVGIIFLTLRKAGRRGARFKTVRTRSHECARSRARMNERRINAPRFSPPIGPIVIDLAADTNVNRGRS